MEIVKHGKNPGIKVVCTSCSCEFVCYAADISYRGFDPKTAEWRATVKCPDCGEYLLCPELNEK